MKRAGHWLTGAERKFRQDEQDQVEPDSLIIEDEVDCTTQDAAVR